MPEHEIYVAGTTANLLLDYLATQGLALPELQGRLHALAALQRMPVTTWQALLVEIQQIRKVPALGLEIGQCVQPHHIGVLGYLAIHSDTLAQAMMRFGRFQPLIHNVAPSVIHPEGDALIVGWDGSRGGLPLLSDEVLVSGLMTLIRRHTGQLTAAPRCVNFPHPQPHDVTPYQSFFACPVSFNQPMLSVNLPLSLVDLPVTSQEPHLTKLLEQQAESMMQALPSGDALILQLQHHIGRVLQDGSPEFKVVAARMGIAERSLYRSLNERGLRYKTIVNTMRFKLAKDYLADPSLSLPEIALLLGFAEQSAFSRAFKEWSDESPMTYRRARIARR
ncbi:MAG: AraC family transcriptional regulator ligand-binding domain-containing protein [Aquabacterium sp.]|nr:AraC family transcriptional regulator ligand-binding domain-containing protein [Aquabacterium sp.]